MSVKAMTWAFDQPIAGNEKVILLCLADHANDEGECWPSVQRMAKKAFVSDRTVQSILLKLADHGYLSSVSRADGAGRQISNKYVLQMGEGEDVSPRGEDRLHPGGEGEARFTGGGEAIFTPNKPSLRTITKISLSETSSDDHKSVASPQPEKPAPAKPAKKRSPYPDDFEAFWREYPTDAIMSKKAAAAAWEKLPDADRATARAAIPKFRAHCSKNPDYRPVHAVRFLTQRRFEGMISGPIPADDDAIWKARMDYARSQRKWPTKWGPWPHQDGCQVPKPLLLPDDGNGWAEWRTAS